ncbi:MAG: two-component sensor histidine kinase [Phenylobacterium zucineum]|nr:MAG: two-component sensor histidine kinase [Phenylobacterium zucineum]
MEGRNAKALRLALAVALGVDEDKVRITGDRSPFADRRVLRIVRDQLARQGAPHEELFLVAPFAVSIQQSDGHWRVVKPAPVFGLDAWQQRLVLWFLISAVAMAPIAWIVARRMARPYQLFSQAAERLGRDPQSAPISLALTGASEIKVAAGAFNDMQQRLKRYVEDRTAMVGAIAHDLRTPLTRLKFRIEAAPDELRNKMASDIDQMEQMISGTLNFVRDASHGGTRTHLDLSTLIESLCDDMAEIGTSVCLEHRDQVILNGDPVALRRLFTNLLDNAVKFGGGATTRVFNRDGFALVEIDDNGPGIPEGERDRVFEPFYRREPSRNRDTGGIGLGLAVVRSVARAHGGDVELKDRPTGGMTARVRLPL